MRPWKARCSAGVCFTLLSSMFRFTQSFLLRSAFFCFASVSFFWDCPSLRNSVQFCASLRESEQVSVNMLTCSDSCLCRLAQCLREYGQVCVNLHEFVRICASLRESAWICANLPEFARVCVSLVWFGMVVHVYFGRRVYSISYTAGGIFSIHYTAHPVSGSRHWDNKGSATGIEQIVLAKMLKSK